jgi:para-aminobenzoate synthetase/4-amino-4-deoxychorismate lyase
MRPLPFTTLRIQDGEPWFWDAHIQRLRETAAMLRIPVRPLATFQAALPRVIGGSLRVRITVQADGSLLTESELYEPPVAPWKLKPVPVDADRDQVRIKTTHRAMYDAARDRLRSEDDALLVDLDQTVLETTVGNLFFLLDGALVTPPASLALLPGIARARILAADLGAWESSIDVNSLARATACCVCNALMGAHPVGEVVGGPRYESGELARNLNGALRIQQ